MDFVFLLPASQMRRYTCGRSGEWRYYRPVVDSGGYTWGISVWGKEIELWPENMLNGQEQSLYFFFAGGEFFHDTITISHVSVLWMVSIVFSGGRSILLLKNITQQDLFS